MKHFQSTLTVKPNSTLAERLIGTVTYKSYINNLFNLPTVDELLDWRIRCLEIKNDNHYKYLEKSIDLEIEATDFLLSLHNK